MKAAIVLVRRADGGQIVAFNVGSLIGEPVDFLAARALAAFSCRMKTGRGEQCFYRETERKSMNFCCIVGPRLENEPPIRPRRDCIDHDRMRPVTGFLPANRARVAFIKLKV